MNYILKSVDFTHTSKTLMSNKGFFMIRHGERADQVPANADPNDTRSYHKTDPSLTPNGKQMGVFTGQFIKYLTSENPTKKFCIISSPYYRCLQTATKIIEGLGPEKIYQKTLFVEDAFEEWYNQDCMVEMSANSRGKWVFANMDDKLTKELFTQVNYKHNTLFNYSDKDSMLKNDWEESFQDCCGRYVAGMELVSDLVYKKENEEIEFIVVTHGFFADVFKMVIPDDDIEFPEYSSLNRLMCLKNDADDESGLGYSYKLDLNNYCAWKY